MPNDEWLIFIKLVCGCFLRSIELKNYLLPSKLMPYLLARVEIIFSDNHEYNILTSSLNLPTNFHSDVVDQFLLIFLMSFPLEILKFISKSVCGVVSQDNVVELDEEDKEVIYYIAGSIMRGYFRIAYRYKNNPKWFSIMQALQEHVLTKGPTEDAAGWTEKVDRGGLLYITSQCQEFCVSLTRTIFQCEKHDGSVDYEEVLSNVSKSPLVNKWDQMMSKSLTARVSLILMNNFVKNMCRTCARGFAKKKLNKLRQKPTVSMPLRHQVKTSRG